MEFLPDPLYICLKGMCIMKKEFLSVVICVYNEAPNVEPLVERIRRYLDGIDYEVVFVDDGSADGTPDMIAALDDPVVSLVELKKNYGQSAALAAGIDYARGDYIVTMDGDLQNDPQDILPMLEKLKTGRLDMVAGVRKDRKDGFFLRKIPSRIANAIIRLTTHVKMKDYGCTLKVFNRETAKDLHLYGELHRFIPVLASYEGAKIGQMEVHHHRRQYGKSKYGIGRTFKVVSDLLFMLFMKRYMSKPMHLFGNWGIFFLLGGLAINLYLLYLKILGQDIWGKPLLILGVILLVAGFQLITIGILAEVLMRTYYESQKKKHYNVKSILSGGKQGKGKAYQDTTDIEMAG